MQRIKSILLSGLFLFVLSIGNLWSQEKNYWQNHQDLPPLSKEDSIGLSGYPKLVLPEWFKGPKAPLLPLMVDNSQNIHWRPVFAQVGLECGQASGVGLGFTYALNRERNLPSNLPENQYATHFTWNFGNGGSGWYGVSYFHSFEIIRTLGNPSVAVYGGMSAGGGSRWMTGYDNYYHSMHNRINEVYQIDVSTEEGILTAKNWFHNHLEGDAVGGVANFYTSCPSANLTLPAGTPEAGKYVVTSWTYANHAMTIAGYHDSICWDYNMDGQYTNNIDINNDGVVNVRDWEIGGFKFANTYSGGPSWANNGFCYMTYKSCADAYGSGGIWNNAFHVLYAKNYTNPVLTAKITLKHDCRHFIRVRMGVTTDTISMVPQFIIGFPVFNYQAGCFYMQGGTNQNDKIIEFGLDLTPFINMFDPGTPLRYFLLVDEADPDSIATGEIINYSLMDYSNGVLEIPCNQSNVELTNNDLTKIWINHTQNFNDIIIDTDTLPPATVYEPYSATLEATGGTPSYYWDFDKNFSETYGIEEFPMVTTQQLNPGSNYVTKQLEFSFPFYGKEYSQVRIFADGYIMFENELTWPYQVYEFLKFTKNKYIAPFMTDLTLYPSSGDGVWYDGNQNAATFRWKASVNGYQGSSELNFAVKLYNNGNIKFYYGAVNNYPEIEWLSGVSAGDNKYYQFTDISGHESIQPYVVCHLDASHTPEGFEMMHNGIFNGMADETYDNFGIRFMATDQNNLKDSRILYLSTDGTNFLVIDDYSVLSGDDNIIEIGETVSLNVSIKNLGDNPIAGASMEISVNDNLIILADSTEFLGDFSSGEIKTFTNAFVFEVSEEIPNDYSIDIQTLITDNTGEDWSSHIYLTAFAPELYIGNVTIEDGGNGCLDPGETANMIVKIINSGGAQAADIVATLSTADPFITINNGVANLASVNPYSIGNISFNITASDITPIGYIADFTVDFTAAFGLTGTGIVSITVGQTPVLIIDLDENSSSAFAMEDAMNEIGVSYETSDVFPADLNLYSSIFICLGIYPENHVLSANDGQLLANYLNNNGNLYMEGGDTWFYDSQTAVHPMFNIDGEADGTSDLGTVNGQAGTFTENMAFYYSGENSWIDHINPISPAELILENQSPVYGTGISYDEGNYRTIGTSHEFGGLADGISPSTKVDLMTAYLEFFGIISFDLIANFQADQTQVCEYDSVHFTDYSVGNINSWSWEFEGGDPPVSTLQHPVVSYNEAGVFDVSLIISNSSVSDTIVKQNFIVVHSFPGIPAKPSGDNEVCTNLTTTSVYITAGGSFANSYIWEILPAEAGIITGTGISATVDWTINWEGIATVKVKGYNDDCGEGEYSEALEVLCMVCTGEFSTMETNGFSIIPNPSEGEFYLISDKFSGTATIVITNLFNEMVFKENHSLATGTKIRISLTGQPAGVYLISILAGETLYNEKIVIR
jgi:PKD repeat protein